MTIKYLDGTVLQGLLVSRGDDTLRAAFPGDDDVRTFTLVSGTWISEECEPVKLNFPQRGEQAREVEVVCSKKQTSRIMSVLRACSGDDSLENMLYVFSAEGRRVRIQQSRLNEGRVPAEGFKPGCSIDSPLLA